MGVKVQSLTPAALTLGQNRYPLYRRLGAPRAGVDQCRKSRPQQDSIPGPSSPQRVAMAIELFRNISESVSRNYARYERVRHENLEIDRTNVREMFV